VILLTVAMLLAAVAGRARPRSTALWRSVIESSRVPASSASDAAAGTTAQGSLPRPGYSFLSILQF